jgi:hypothetical protein
MILETPNFNVTNIIFESYEHRSKIIPPLLTSFVFITVCFVPHSRTVDLSISLQLIVKISIHLK